MIENPRKIRRIYMVSSAVFGAASCVFGWAAPLGAALGLAVDLTEDSKLSNSEEFDHAVSVAISRTRDSMTSDSNRKIIDELSKSEIEPDNLSDLIKNTETYQTKYCTRANVVEIVNSFEMYFRDEISKRPNLSNLYVLSTGFVTLEKLKMMNEILYSEGKKLDEISVEIAEARKEISTTNKIITAFNVAYKNCLNGLISILVSMGAFLIFGVFLFPAYSRLYLTIAPICYGISYFLTYYVVVKRDMLRAEYFGLKNHILWVILNTFLIPVFIAVACFLIMNLAINQTTDSHLLTSTIGIALGNFISILITSRSQIWKAVL